MATSLFNGETAVVAVFISRILFSTPPSLLYEGLALALLAFSALFVELFAEASNSLGQFKIRPGASSGILLGAVTLPGLMISKLIQLSRALSVHEIGVEEYEYMRLQYWAMSACCCGVLVLVCFILQHLPNYTHAGASRSDWHVKCNYGCIVIYTVVCCVCFAAKSGNGWYTALKLLWVLSHGLAAIKLIQHMLHTFPSCASIGEVLLLAAGLVVYFGDMFACTITKIHGYVSSSELNVLQNGIRRSEISIIIQGMLLGLLVFPLFFKFINHVWKRLSSSSYSATLVDPEIGSSLVFYASMAFILILIVPSWMQFVQDFHMHPLLWVINFVFLEPLKRLSLCIYWVALILVSVRGFYNISKNSKTERILLRKYYHLLAVSMFVPALIFQPKFLELAFGAALAMFLVLEIIRVWRIWPLGQFVHQFMNAFTDHRDSDLLIVSHFSLLLGCALPIWLSSGFNDRPLAPFAGILSLGIGDTMASMVGYKYGVLRWSKSGKKTVEGTAAGITSVLAACSLLLPLLAATGYIFTQQWFSLVFAVIVSGLLEAYTAQLDNAFIPLVFYSLLCL